MLENWTTSRRNRWTLSIGITGRLESESVDDFDRNRWTTCPGILIRQSYWNVSSVGIDFEPLHPRSLITARYSRFRFAQVGTIGKEDLLPISNRTVKDILDLGRFDVTVYFPHRISGIRVLQFSIALLGHLDRAPLLVGLHALAARVDVEAFDVAIRKGISGEQTLPTILELIAEIADTLCRGLTGIEEDIV
ncbi:MAG: hypothetical protein DMF37_09545, partial [Verrucomicrobia bacterium]